MAGTSTRLDALERAIAARDEQAVRDWWQQAAADTRQFLTRLVGEGRGPDGGARVIIYMPDNGRDGVIEDHVTETSS